MNRQDASRAPVSEAAPAPAWHALGVTEVMERLQADERGLGAAGVAARRERYGPNRLPPPARRSALARLGAQFNNVLIYVLLIAAGVTAILQHWIDSGVILGVVLINALIGFIQEGKAEEALDAVRNLLSPQAQVMREGRRQIIEATELVPGDIVLLQSGDKVPADLRLLRARDLRIDESLLTGESVPVGKAPQPVAEDAVVAERSSLAYSGSLVTYGLGTGVVVATGTATEIGRISTLLSHVETLTTPLLRMIGEFGRWLTAGILGIAAIMFAFGVWLRDYSATDMFLASVGLAVAAIPEGLPAIITITLAIGVQRMARRNAIIRRLPAVETLGSVTVICSDKTGTLTRNEMTVQAVAHGDRRFRIEGEGYDPHGGWLLDERPVDVGDHPGIVDICRAALLCNDASVRHEDGSYRFAGEPMEAALAVLAVKGGLVPQREDEDYPRIDTIPFESEHKFMATLHHDHAGHAFVFVKGAPEVLLPRCHNERDGGEDRPLRCDHWEAEIERLARQGYRTLALAAKPMPAGLRELAFGDIDGQLTLLAVVGLLDPPREEATRAVAACRAAGIRVKMITGDHAVTAASIAGRMGIGEAQGVVTGAEIENADDRDLVAAAAGADVFARVSPEHKLRLVRALQAGGEVTAMTGDGVNDAPALKRADVGIAMGVKGTEAAKEAAEMVLADDNFASIAAAVEEGRTVFDNIRKSILFILPTNGGEALIILAAVLLGRLLPVTPAQILWVNMITAVTLALALAFEPAEARVMARRPRDPGAPLLSGFMVWRIGFVAVLMVAGAFGLFLLTRHRGGDIEMARTVAVNTLVLAEVAYVFNARFTMAPSWTADGLFGSRPVVIAVVLVTGFQLLFTYAPFMQRLFQSRSLPAVSWAWMVAVAVALFLLVEIEKALIRRWSGFRAAAHEAG